LTPALTEAVPLAPYACDPAASRGRRFRQEADPDRSEFQRDRDRIVHSSGFRRLVYKTQVFLNHEGDLFRTRLTHSLEVAQLARSIARSLQLNEDLVEAISLAHDIGHTPFGHAGQDALNDCMAAYGGFEHNVQSLRVVDHLEQRYPAYDGLNLCFETREGILKHCSARNATALEALEPQYGDRAGGVGRRFLERTQPSLEAQLCNVADEIAYNAHDIDDGVRSGLIALDQLREVRMFDEYNARAQAAHPGLGCSTQARRLLYETIRLMLNCQVHDVISASRQAIAQAGPRSVCDVRACPVLVSFGVPVRDQLKELKAFLTAKLYRHPQVVQTMTLAKRVVKELFAAYLTDPEQMQSAPQRVARAMGPLQADDTAAVARLAADYIAGMTDRFASSEHERLTGQRLLAAQTEAVA
jgi:dGTPase